MSGKIIQRKECGPRTREFPDTMTETVLGDGRSSDGAYIFIQEEKEVRDGTGA